MKFIIMFLILFIPNAFAETDALSCSYKIGDDTINFRFYPHIDDDKIMSESQVAIHDFMVNGESYSYFTNFVFSTGETTCPDVFQVELEGDPNKYYFIANNYEHTKETITNDDGEDETIEHYIFKDPDPYHSEYNWDLYKGRYIDYLDSFPTTIKSINITSLTLFQDYIHYEIEEITASGGISDETREQMNINIDAYANGACTYKEKNAIAGYFNGNDFFSLTTFYGSNIFEVDDEYITLSDDCALIATTLYNSTVNLVYMLSDYADNGGDKNTMNYLSLESSYYAALNAFETPWASTSYNEDICDVIDESVRNLLNNFFASYRLICIILAIFMIYLDGMKCLTEKDDTATKKWISKSIKRMIVLILVLMLPTLVNIVLDLVEKYTAGSYINVNGKCVKAITGG